MKIELKNENDRIQNVSLGFDFIFFAALLFGFIVLPFALLVVFRKQYKEMMSAYILVYIVNSLLVSYIYITDNFNPIVGMLNIVVLFVALYIFPKYMNIWRAKRLNTRGFVPTEKNTEEMISKYNSYVENDTVFGTMFRL